MVSRMKTRNSIIVERLATGEFSCQDLAEEFGVSRERIRQIGARHGVGSKNSRLSTAKRRKQKEEAKENRLNEQKRILHEAARLFASGMTLNNPHSSSVFHRIIQGNCPT